MMTGNRVNGSQNEEVRAVQITEEELRLLVSNYSEQINVADDTEADILASLASRLNELAQELTYYTHKEDE